MAGFGFSDAVSKGLAAYDNARSQRFLEEQRNEQRAQWELQRQQRALDQQANAAAARVLTDWTSSQDAGAATPAAAPPADAPAATGPGLGAVGSMGVPLGSAGPDSPAPGPEGDPMPAPGAAAAPTSPAGAGLGALRPPGAPGGPDSPAPGPEGDAPAAGAMGAAKAGLGAATKSQPKPPPADVILRGLQARGDVYARAGNLNSWMQNEAQAAALRTQIRNQVIDQALPNYELTKDAAGLVKAIYPHVADGLNVEDSKMTMTADGKEAVAITTSDGKVRVMPVTDLITTITRMRADPSKVAEYELKTAYERNKAAFETQGKLTVVQEQGDQARQTEGVKHEGDMVEIAARGANDVQVANIGAASRVQAAGISASATRYSADQHAKTASGKNPDGTPKIHSVKDLEDGTIAGVTQAGQVVPLKGPDGNPLRSADFGKRVDQVVKDWRTNDPKLRKLSETELREKAKAALLDGIGGGAPAPAPPPAPGPGLADAAKPPAAAAPKPAGAASAPFRDGQKLRGPDGKLYIVKNGQPVPAQ